MPALLAREIVLRTSAVSGKLYALIGAVVSMPALARLHNRAMARLEKENAAP